MSKIAIAKTNALTHEQWLKIRQGGIGGSDAGAICGLNPWKTPLALYLEKTAETVVETPDNEAMYWGRTLEPVLRQEFAKRSGLKVEEVPLVFQSKEHPCMIANIDGIAHEEDGTVSLVEIKTVSQFAAKEWENGLPASYYIQVQHYLAVCNLAKAYVVRLIGGNNFDWITVERDEEAIAALIKMEEDFWYNHVLKRVEPEVNEHDADTLASMYPNSTKTSVILPEAADGIIEEYLRLKQQEDELKAFKTAFENDLKAMLKDAECGKTPAGHSVSWKSATTNRLDTTRLKKDKPELVEQYTVQSTVRKFGIKPAK